MTTLQWWTLVLLLYIAYNIGYLMRLIEGRLTNYRKWTPVASDAIVCLFLLIVPLPLFYPLSAIWNRIVLAVRTRRKKRGWRHA